MHFSGIYDIARSLAEKRPVTDDYKDKRATLLAFSQAALTRDFIEASHAQQRFDNLADQIAARPDEEGPAGSAG